MNTPRNDITATNKASSRRNFLKRSAFAGSGLCFLAAGSRGQGAEPVQTAAIAARSLGIDCLITNSISA
jgi:hypothetical protein